MKKMNLLLISALCVTAMSCNEKEDKVVNTNVNMKITPSEITLSHEAATSEINVTSDREWKVYSTEKWINYTPSSSINPEETVKLSIDENSGKKDRSAYIIFMSGTHRDTVKVYQQAAEQITDPSIVAPEGYELVWNDEFNAGSMPDMDSWSYETGTGVDGWGNNELQNYVAGSVNGENLANIKDGIFSITAKKIGSTVYSIRINTKESWTYGYFEARLKLPKGKGTWPAFWMMPKNFTSWPADGEIDIMEEVGYRPNYVSSAIHCKAYNGSLGNQKVGEKFISTAESDFHIYALEWTENSINTYVDGELIFTYNNDGKGKDTWPFNQPFYIKLNLAWGGNWGGAQGVDESALPATYEIDYVRVFQKIKN